MQPRRIIYSLSRHCRLIWVPLYNGDGVDISLQGWCLDVMSLIGPSVVQLVVFYNSGCQCLRRLPRATPTSNLQSSVYLVQIVDTYSNTEWQTVQIQISWLLKKPTDLDLFAKHGTSRFSRKRVTQAISFLLIVLKR